MSKLIEEYLAAKGVRYFRGHHDDEYFFLVDAVVEGRRKRLHVFLQGHGRDAVQISITPDRYYPSGLRAQLAEVAARWKGGEPSAEVAIADSSDPGLVGISAHFRVGPAGFLPSVDQGIAAAIDLFAEMRRVAHQGEGLLRDAG